MYSNSVLLFFQVYFKNYLFYFTFILLDLLYGEQTFIFFFFLSPCPPFVKVLRAKIAVIVGKIPCSLIEIFRLYRNLLPPFYVFKYHYILTVSENILYKSRENCAQSLMCTSI
jgi:hypothetical protein